MLAASKSYRFSSTQDWFSKNIDRWASLFRLVETQAPRALEIGSWEGRSACFLLENFCKDTGEMVCIDHFDLMKTPAGRERYAKVTHNLSQTGSRFRILDEFSVPGLMKLLVEEMDAKEPGYDWIYIDGSHRADDTFLDGELVWRLARDGAIVIFDDYRWDAESEESIHHPKRGIDAFMTLHTGEYIRLSSATEYQMILQKTCSMRIGFLEKPSPAREPQSISIATSVECGINIAIVTDSTYAFAAAVAIRGALKCTAGRVTVYVIDGGLSNEEKDKLRDSVAISEEKTLVFIDIPDGSDSLAKRQGLTWARIDALEILPIQRVIYLDADVLVRGSLNDLWDIDLDGKSIGAVIDIGLPKGHSGISGPYFNAGVLLVDIAKARAGLASLKSLSATMKDSKYKDQDALNIHFAGDWAELQVSWNAQGLGTYASIAHVDRAQIIDSTDLENPRIVHFTGPVHPSLADVLNPWVQPYTAKPWGYAEAPGHPFAVEWWKALEMTPWCGMQSSAAFAAVCKAEEERAVENAKEGFHKKLKQIPTRNS